MSSTKIVRKGLAKMSKVDELLGGIIESMNSTKASMNALQNSSEGQKEEVPLFVSEIMKKLNVDKLEGVSLLGLKNDSLLGYLHNIVLVILAHIERIGKYNNSSEIEGNRKKAIEGTIVQRVCLEKGVKPLEKKLNYQLDKIVRTYVKMEAEQANREKETEATHEQGNESANSEEESASLEEEDALSYKPDAKAFLKQSNGKMPASASAMEKGTDKYRPPKITAMVPQLEEAREKRPRNRKLQSMEEYIQEASDAPHLESSIGSTIEGQGRYGVKTNYDREKEKEVENYEEENFTRLPTSVLKKSSKKRQQQNKDIFAGEDWSIFNKNRDYNESSRKRKQGTAWDRVKRKHN